jgi:hypothetical protein
MTQDEIMAKYKPIQLENQMQFEQIMEQMNQEQYLEKEPLFERKHEIAKQNELLNIQKRAINQQLSALSIEYQEIEQKIRSINLAYHNVKHEFIMLNPRENFIKTEEQ